MRKINELLTTTSVVLGWPAVAISILEVCRDRAFFGRITPWYVIALLFGACLSQTARMLEFRNQPK